MSERMTNAEAMRICHVLRINEMDAGADELKRARASEDQKEAVIKALADATTDLLAALESTRWSSGCWCSGKDRCGHSATCAGRQASINQMETALRLAGRL